MFDYIYISEPITKVNISITPKIFLMPCGNLSLLKQTSLQPPARQTLIYFLPLLICLYFLEFSMYVIRQSLFSFFSFLFFFFFLIWHSILWFIQMNAWLNSSVILLLVVFHCIDSPRFAIHSPTMHILGCFQLGLPQILVYTYFRIFFVNI